MTEQPTFADLEYQHKKATDPSGGVSEANRLPYSLGEVGGAHPAPLLLRLSGVVGLTPCRRCFGSTSSSSATT